MAIDDLEMISAAEPGPDGDGARVFDVVDPRLRLLPETGIRVNNTSQLQSNKFIG